MSDGTSEVREAKAILNNVAFIAAVDSVRADLITKAMNCSPQNDTGRRRYLDAAKTVDRVVSHLNAVVIAAKSGDEVDTSTYYQDEAAKRWGVFQRFINP